MACAEGPLEEPICGRPLGMAFDNQGNNLIVADAYYGIWLLNLDNGKKTLLVGPNEELDGKVNRLNVNQLNQFFYCKFDNFFFSLNSNE